MIQAICKNTFCLGAIILGAALSVPAIAAVSADEAKQLGTTLTPMGAEKAGNKEGTIPAFEGQVKIPANYDPKKPGIRPDPFANEKPLFTINAQNMAKYADKLSEGVKAMLVKYPTFRLDIYPSHRIGVFPPLVVENTLKNATACKSTNDGLTIEGCYGGLPFPIPKTGREAMWNHNLVYKGVAWYFPFNSYYVDNQGHAQLQGLTLAHQEQPFYDPAIPGVRPGNMMYWRYRGPIDSPARHAGEVILLHDPVDQLGVGRRVWSYIPGQRRIKLAPDLAYDTPSPQSGGSQNMDDAQVFLGALDRFDFKLVGKKEMYIPYNNYKFFDASVCSDKVKYTKSHSNPDCWRWELHRVWQVEATLRPGFRHVYAKRTFYWDEDQPGSGMADNYDAAGKIYRISYNAGYAAYESQSWMADCAFTHDVLTGVYAQSGDTTETQGMVMEKKLPPEFFSPEAVAAAGIR